MTSCFPGCRLSYQGRARSAVLLALLLLPLPLPRTVADNLPGPRENYNAGTLKLKEGKLREAEALLEMVLASQAERLQPPALYNLGHVRFRQGLEELKKGPAAGGSLSRGKSASDAADEAIKSADEALKSAEMQALVTSYVRGRGARKEVRAAMKQVKLALDAHGTTLRRWQRASGDFRSVLELKPGHPDATQNAAIVDRHIARLIDSIRELQQMAQAMGEKLEELRQKMQQVKGQIPDKDMPPGASGDDEESEEPPKGPEEGQKEPPQKEGEEMKLSPEQAGWILEGFKLDSERQLPMGQESTERRERNGRDW